MCFQTESFSPPYIENNVKINELFAMNGFLVAATLKVTKPHNPLNLISHELKILYRYCIFQEQTKVFQDVFICKINSNAEVEWKNFLMIPNIHLESDDLFIDHKYMILIFFQPKLESVVRQVSNFGIKQTFTIMNNFTNDEYATGYVSY